MKELPAQTPLLYVPTKGVAEIKRVHSFTVKSYPERYQHQTVAAYIKQYIKTGVAHPRMTESEFLGLLVNDLTQREREILCQQAIDARSNKSNCFGLFNHEARQNRLNKVSTALTTGKVEVSIEQPICTAPGWHSK